MTGKPAALPLSVPVLTPGVDGFCSRAWLLKRDAGNGGAGRLNKRPTIELTHCTCHCKALSNMKRTDWLTILRSTVRRYDRITS